MPSTRGSFAPLMLDSVLQQYGWDAGWSLLAEIAANAQLFTPGPAFVTDSLLAGLRGILPIIDFFVGHRRKRTARRYK